MGDEVKSKKVALISGAMGAIGSGLAELFARDGYDLILIAREDKLHDLSGRLVKDHGVGIKTIIKDLALPRSVDEIFSEISRESSFIEILVNNAGVGAYGEFSEMDLPAVMEQINVNMTASTRMIKLILPGMLKRRKGKILNVASIASFFSGPYMAVYYATKAYLLRFSEALACELKGTGVTVTALCPGLTRTDFEQNAGMRTVSWVRNLLEMNARGVVRAGYAALMNGKGVCIPGPVNKLFALATRLLPRKFVTVTMGFYQRNMKKKFPAENDYE